MNTPCDTAKDYLATLYSKSQIEQLTDQQILWLYKKSQPKKVPIQQLEDTYVDSYLVNSADGFVRVKEWRNKGTKPCVKITTFSGRSITASTDHFFEMNTGLWKYAQFIVPGEKVKIQDNTNEVVKSVSLAGDQTVYDFHIDHQNHRYYTNGFSSHNSGAGKSLFLANLGVNWSLAGLNVVYITLELSENLVSMRIDSMLTGVSTREIFRNLDDVETKVRIIGKKSGSLQVKYMPSGKTPNDIRSYLKEYEIKTNRKVDVLLIDYLDLLMPNGAKVSPENLFIKDKYVSEELRNLAMELNTVFVTAAQLNRGAVEEIEFDHSHISGGLSKIQTADNVIGIFTSRAMRERGRYQVQLMKTRSSSGVGSKIDLGFDVDCLRIYDLGEDEDGGTSTPNEIKSNSEKASAILGNLSRNKKATEEPQKKIKAEAESTKLRQFLSNLGDDE